MEDYEKLFEEAYSKLKPIESTRERFETPKVEGHIEGNKTIITNFKQIASYLRRDPGHMLKILLRDLAAFGSIKGDRLVLNRKIPSRQINEKLQLYINTFVLCKECKKPDTEIIKKDRFSNLHCLACGAKHAIK